MKYNLPVEGMTCASCVARVEKALNKIDGIDNVAVNFANEKVTFEINENVNLETAKQAVEKYGYKLDTNIQQSENLDKNNEELKDNYYEKLKKDFLFSALLTLPIFLVSMTREFAWFTSVWPFDVDYTNKILLILTTPIIFISGKRFYKIFWTNLKHFSFEMNSLVAIGTGAAYCYSVVATLFPDLLKVDDNIPHVYFETAAVIIVLITMGKLLEANAKKKTGGDRLEKLGHAGRIQRCFILLIKSRAGRIASRVAVVGVMWKFGMMYLCNITKQLTASMSH